MTAVMWKVLRLRSVTHYGIVEEFVSLVTEAIPDILTDRQMRLFTVGLRAKMTLQMLSSEQAEDLRGVETLLSSLLPSHSKQVHPGNETFEANFARLVQRLLEDPKEREHFLKNVFPVEFGHDFDAALEALACEFFTRLEELLLIPDFKQCPLPQSSGSSHPYLSLLHCERQTPKMLNRTHGHFRTKENLMGTQEKWGYRMQDGHLRRRQTLGTAVMQKKTKEGKCTPNVYVVEEFDDGAPDTCRAPSTSTESLVLSSSAMGPPRRRVAHKCAHCGKCFIYRYELLEHQRLHTGENPYKCSQCGKAFRRTSDLSSHRRTQCTKAAYVCIKCGSSFQSVQGKCRHQCVRSVLKFDCSQCGKSFKTMHLLGKHELTHGKGRIFTCRQCGKVCPSMSELRSHQSIHPPELSNQCTQCGKLFRSAACLSAHELRHRQQRTQICVRCGKAFKNKHDLSLHMRSHTGERPFQCTYCGKRFSVSGNLNIHVRIHTGEKPYLCSDCGKAFVSAGELQIHRRTHTGEKPYKCAVCGRGFTMASKVTLHMRVHTGERPYICCECGKGFSRGSELKKHTMNHTGVRPHACQLCAKTYTCLNHLKRHLKTHSVVQHQTV